MTSSIKKRGDSYRVQVRRKGFPPESATFRDRAQAVEWGKAREAELVRTRHGIIPRRTVRQALEKWRDDVSPTHGRPRWETVRIEKLLRELPFVDRQINQVAPHDIAQWRDDQRKTLAESSVAHEYGIVRRIFKLAATEWIWLRDSPFARVAAPPAGDARTRRVAEAETDASSPSRATSAARLPRSLPNTSPSPSCWSRRR